MRHHLRKALINLLSIPSPDQDQVVAKAILDLLKTASHVREAMTNPIPIDRCIDVWRARQVMLDRSETIATGIERALESLELTPLEAIRIASVETENHHVICFVSADLDHLAGCFYFSRQF